MFSVLELRRTEGLMKGECLSTTKEEKGRGVGSMLTTPPHYNHYTFAYSFFLSLSLTAS